MKVGAVVEWGPEGGKKAEDRGIYLELLTHESIPYEVGSARICAAPALLQSADETHTGRPMPACHALAAVTLAPGGREHQQPPWTFNLGWV